MNKENGFIATSLIYSFFLAFIAVLTSLLVSYIANKTILDRFNEDTIDSLNNPTYTLSVYAVNANIDSGMAFTNLISESTFESLDYWNVSDDNFSKITNYDGTQFAIKKETNSNNSKIEQDIYILGDTKYYYSIRCKNESVGDEKILKSYLQNDINTYGFLECNPSTTSWQKTSNIFTSGKTDAGMYKFIIGDNDFWVSDNSAYYTEAMLINLTDSFGAGKEPEIEWLDKNIDYFSDSVSFITVSEIEKNETEKIRFALFKHEDVDMNRYTLDCGDGISYGTVEVKEINNKAYGEIEIENIDRDMICKIEWTVP